MLESDDRLLIEHQGPVCLLTINRPEKLNALDLVLVTRLAEVLDALAAEPEEELRAVVLTGAGDKAFVAGADIAELLERGHREALQAINAGLFRRVEEFPWPVIAALRGWVVGGGLELAMACDLRIAGESARFRQPELGLGILPAAGAMYRLPELVGMGHAKDMILTGRIVDARTALAMGLVSRVVADAKVLEEALSAAQDAAKMAPLASRLAKTTMRAISPLCLDTAMAMESAAQAVLFESEEKKRRMRAFLDGRS